MKNYIVQLSVMNEDQFSTCLNILCSYDNTIKANDLRCIDREGERWILIKSKLSLVQIYNLKFVKFVIEIPDEDITINWKRKFDKKDMEKMSDTVENFEQS